RLAVPGAERVARPAGAGDKDHVRPLRSQEQVVPDLDILAPGGEVLEREAEPPTLEDRVVRHHHPPRLGEEAATAAPPLQPPPARGRGGTGGSRIAGISRRGSRPRGRRTPAPGGRPPPWTG